MTPEPLPANMNSSSNTQLTATDTSDEPIVDVAYKKSFSSFLKSILGKDVDSVRVSVPLWLLEPTSNLQYLGSLEFLEHFATAPTKPTPLSRMVNVVTMFLASLNKATKKAKKPINPILGELFYTSFRPSAKSISTNSTLPPKPESEEPLPDVFLVGEQISHHPPLSAFYAICPATGINVTLLFDLKAKFNGLSFSLQNESHATVCIPSHNEEYLITYPNANLVGVLSMAFRLMWTGSCSVTCNQSQLKATISFKEKRWFGRETYEISGTISSTESSTSSPLATLSGNWNGKMYIEYADQEGEKQLLFDSGTADPHYHMHIPPNDILPQNASGNVWHRVIESMLNNDSTTANKEKSEIENKQRDLEAKRKPDVFVPRFFKFHAASTTSSCGSDKQTLLSNRIKYIGGDLPKTDDDIKRFLA